MQRCCTVGVAQKPVDGTGLTRFGSMRGCLLEVDLSEITVGGAPDLTCFLIDSDTEGCGLTPGSGSGPGGAVRVDRLLKLGN